MSMREDRNYLERVTFDCLTVTSCEIATVVKLLSCQEENVLTNAILCLARYAAKSPESHVYLYRCDIIPILLELLHHTNTHIVRFALKILSILVRTSEVANDLMLRPRSIAQIADFLINGTDEFQHEYTAGILAVVTKNYNRAIEIYNLGVMRVAWMHVCSNADPDTLNSCLVILYNLLQIKRVVDDFVSTDGFTILPLVIHFTSHYIELQKNALQVMKQIAAAADDIDLCNLSKQSNIFEYLMEVLEDDQYKDVQLIILEIMCELLGWEDTVTFFIEKENLPRFLTVLETMHDLDKLYLATAIVILIAKTDLGRHELYLQCIDKFLKELLNSQQEPLIVRACKCINAMVIHNKAVKLFTDKETVEMIVSCIEPPIAEEWNPDRSDVIEALNYLVWADPAIPDFLISTDSLNTLLHILNTCIDRMPQEVYEKFVRIFQVFSLCTEWKDVLLKTELLASIAKLFDRSETKIQLAALEIMQAYMCDPHSVDWLIESGIYRHLFNYLKDPDNDIVFATVSLLNQLCKYKKIAYLFIKDGLLNQMHGQAKQQANNPIWGRTIEQLLNTHLPSKFNYKNRLDITDITEDKFYVSRRKLEVLPVLEDLLQEKLCAPTIFYVSIFQYKKPPVKELKTVFQGNEKVVEMINEVTRTPSIIEKMKYVPYKLGKSGSISSIQEPPGSAKSSVAPGNSHSDKKGTQNPKINLPEERLLYRYRSLTLGTKTRMRLAGMEREFFRIPEKPEIPSEEAFAKIAPRLLSWLGRLPPDPYLNFYRFELRYLFNLVAGDEMTPVRKLVYRIETLAQYVYRCTSGPIKGDSYLTDDNILHHVNKLKIKYGTNMIPLGFLRIGSYLERAVLFKVLADRMEIPCALQRGNQDRAWVEVPLIGLVVDVEYQRCKFEGPVVFFVVDLMQHPGRLYPVGTSYAQEYCCKL